MCTWLKFTLQKNIFKVYNQIRIHVIGIKFFTRRYIFMRHIDEIQIAGTAVLLCGAMFAISAVAPTGNTVSKAVTNFIEAPETAAEAQAQAEEQAEENGFPIYTQESNYDYNSDDGSSYDDSYYDDSSYNDNTYDDQQDNADQGYDNTDNGDGSSDDTGNDDQTSGDESGDDSSDQIDYPIDDTTGDNTDGSLDVDGTEENNYDNAEQITY